MRQMPKAGRDNSALIPTAPLLLTESRDEFDLIRDNLNDQIKPRGIIEQMYVEDIAYSSGKSYASDAAGQPLLILRFVMR
jgi:hypothetical protein